MPGKKIRRPAARRPSPKRPVAKARPAPATLLPYNVTVADVMSRSPLTIGKSASLYDALVLMRTNGITGLPVVGSDGDLEGVLSERDLSGVLGLPMTSRGMEGMMDVLLLDLKEQPEPTLRGFRESLEETQVGEVASQPAYSISPEEPLEAAMEMMTEKSIHRLPVLSGSRLVGVVTTHDLLRAVLPLIRPKRSGRPHRKRR